MNHYVVLGNGTSSANVIENSLSDLPTPRTFHVHIWKNSLDGVCRVYDWLLDNEETFVAYHTGDAPAVLLKHAFDHVVSDTPEVDMADFAEKNKATVLYLWNTESEPFCEHAVMSLLDNCQVPVLDLTQGLTPFLIEDSEAKVVPAEDKLPLITRKEYESMPRATLAQQAKAQGLETTKVTKPKLIDALLGEESEPEENTNEATDFATVIVVFNDGKVEVRKCSSEHALEFLIF